MPWWRRPLDLAWHLILPVTALVAGGFARPTLLTKNAFIDEIGKQYVTTARAKGLTPGRVLYGHVFRNAILVVAVGFPAAFMRMLFVGALLIEIIFSLDGMGLLGFESVVTRDYPVVFGTLYIFTLVGLLVNILTDIATMAIDPRIDFAGRAS
jgi:microcin C transport system permease protein